MMRLRAYDTIHISSIRAENIRPGEEFEVTNAVGAELMKAHPRLFAQVDVGEEKAEPATANKAAPEPENKTEMAPVSATRRTATRR